MWPWAVVGSTAAESAAAAYTECERPGEASHPRELLISETGLRAVPRHERGGGQGLGQHRMERRIVLCRGDITLCCLLAMIWDLCWECECVLAWIAELMMAEYRLNYFSRTQATPQLQASIITPYTGRQSSRQRRLGPHRTSENLPNYQPSGSRQSMTGCRALNAILSCSPLIRSDGFARLPVT